MASVILYSSYPRIIPVTPSLGRRSIYAISPQPKTFITCSSVSCLSSDWTEEKQKPLEDTHYSFGASQKQLFDGKEEKPLAEMWMQIQGCSDWQGQLEPMDPTLRKEIIR